MNILEIIEKKRDKKPLSEGEIHFFVSGVCDGSLPDYQISALLMAICINGMTGEETANLTNFMARSGDTIDLSFIDGVKVDKHSSGGVGDKTTLAVAPMVAACGLSVAKMSGRGLGFSGGTIDKLESISGFRTTLSEDEFVQCVRRGKIAVMGQTKNVAPADKTLYALRDVTGTVPSVPLIAASIMSKKLACNSDAIVLDVKCGNGAFMKTQNDAVSLAKAMAEIGFRNGKSVIAAVTDMNQPLGCAVGNALEVIEAIETLKGNGPADFLELCLTIGGFMLILGGKAQSIPEARELLQNAIKSGAALQSFRQFIENQGGNSAVCDDYSLLPAAKVVRPVTAKKSGFITAIDAEMFGRACVTVKAGRLTKESKIDHSTGFILRKKIGDKVEIGDTLAEIHSADAETAVLCEGGLESAFTIGERHEKNPILIAFVDKGGVHYD